MSLSPPISVSPDINASPTVIVPEGAPYSQHSIGTSVFRYGFSQARPGSLIVSPSHHSSSSIPPVSPTSSPNPHHSQQTQRVTRFTNCRIVREHKIIQEDLWVKQGKIVDAAKRFWEASQENEFAADDVIDCHGLLLAPGNTDISAINASQRAAFLGFIDIQLNGGFGIDFTSPQTDRKSIEQNIFDSSVIKAGILKVARGVLKYGVTSYCPTIITSSPQTYATLLPYHRAYRGSKRIGATNLGIHCEGPFITKRGAHNEGLMQKGAVEPDALVQMYGKENLPYIRIVTLAPEIQGMIDVIDYMHSHHPTIILSSGHSSANYETAFTAYGHGVNLLTHLFNAMVPFTHRDPGIIGLIGSADPQLLHSLFYSIIADGIHTHPASVRIAYQSHPKGVVLITDAMAAMGLAVCDEYHLGKTAVTVQQMSNGRCRAIVTGTTDTLAGSIATMDQCVRVFSESTGCSIVEACEAASTHPAQLLKLQNKGRLNVGCDADIVLLDEELIVKGVWIDGELAWVEENCVTIQSQ